jgi:hypothetical protein
MFELLINKFLLITFFMCVLNFLKHTWGLLRGFMEEIPDKYEITSRDRFILGFSISYILTIIFTGFHI